MENMDKLIMEIGNMMDEKFVNFEAKVDQKFVNFEEKMDQKFVEFEAKIDDKLIAFEIKMDEKFDLRFKELSHRLFMFEQKYSKKIDAIYDSILLEQEKNIEKSEKIHNLRKRAERLEVNVFDHEKRISILEKSN